MCLVNIQYLNKRAEWSRYFIFTWYLIFLKLKKEKNRIYWQTNLLRETQGSRFARARNEGHLFENLHFSTGLAGENYFSLPLIREVKNCTFPSSESEPRPREKLVRCFNERDNFGAARSALVYSATWFIRTGAVCAWYIFIVKTQSPTIWNMYSAAAVRLSRRLDPI